MGSSLPSCKDRLLLGAVECAVDGTRCSGECVNGWQPENRCDHGTWTLQDVVACSPDARECRNAFSGGDPTPCCPEGGFDCSDKPNGYPGYGCTPFDDSFCSCVCREGQQSCAC